MEKAVKLQLYIKSSVYMYLKLTKGGYRAHQPHYLKLPQHVKTVSVLDTLRRSASFSFQILLRHMRHIRPSKESKQC